MRERLITIEAPHFVASISGYDAAPIIRYMAKWSTEKIVRYCKKKGWKVSE